MTGERGDAGGWCSDQQISLALLELCGALCLKCRGVGMLRFKPIEFHSLGLVNSRRERKMSEASTIGFTPANKRD